MSHSAIRLEIASISVHLEEIRLSGQRPSGRSQKTAGESLPEDHSGFLGLTGLAIKART
jgi:hypothetical protein